MRIAILEDQPDQAAVLEETIRTAGHQPHVFLSGRALVHRCASETFDLFVLDWEVPDLAGPEVLAWIRKNVKGVVPVVFVTARVNEADVVSVLERGADDYIAKPVRPRVLVARIEALMRRSYPAATSTLLEVGPFVFDLQARRLRMAGEEVDLTAREFDLALFLFQNAGRLLSRAHIIEAVWGRSSSVLSRSLDTQLSRLRGKLGLGPRSALRIVPVYGHGYRLERD